MVVQTTGRRSSVRAWPGASMAEALASPPDRADRSAATVRGGEKTAPMDPVDKKKELVRCLTACWTCCMEHLRMCGLSFIAHGTHSQLCSPSSVPVLLYGDRRGMSLRWCLVTVSVSMLLHALQA